VVKDTLCKS